MSIVYNFTSTSYFYCLAMHSDDEIPTTVTSLITNSSGSSLI
jgi:hypothetical protein